MTITTCPFGHTEDGKAVTAYKIESSKGAYLEAIDYGCTVTRLCVPDKLGKLRDVVLGYDTIEEYENGTIYLGATVGRHANRIGGAEFVLNGKTYKLAQNNGDNHLHGGIKGFDRHMWSCEIVEGALRFSRTSPDGEEGYPAKLEVTVTYTFSEENEFSIGYFAKSDADTVCNLANHAYFNLNGSGDIEGHALQINADSYTPNDSGCLPTGEIAPVDGTPMDFRQLRPISFDGYDDFDQTAMFGGYDHNYVLRGDKTAAVLYSEESGIEMTVTTDQPGLQFYSGNAITKSNGKDGASYSPHCGLCLEAQCFPNGMAKANFPSPILRKGEEYRRIYTCKFTAHE